MIVQWCVKGLQLNSDAEARAIIDSRGGLFCNWGRTVHEIPICDIPDKLTARNLDMHVNHFLATDPATGQPFYKNSAFISLSCGTIERDAAAQTNLVHRARQTALMFGTQFGERTIAYLYLCWVVIGPRSAVEVQGVSEEIRDVNTYRRYSQFQTQGEVTAKILVPDNQIRWCEKWEWDRPGRIFNLVDVFRNPRFVRPEKLSNVRELI